MNILSECYSDAFTSWSSQLSCELPPSWYYEAKNTRSFTTPKRFSQSYTIWELLYFLTILAKLLKKIHPTKRRAGLRSWELSRTINSSFEWISCRTLSELNHLVGLHSMIQPFVRTNIITSFFFTCARCSKSYISRGDYIRFKRALYSCSHKPSWLYYTWRFFVHQ